MGIHLITPRRTPKGKPSKPSRKTPGKTPVSERLNPLLAKAAAGNGKKNAVPVRIITCTGIGIILFTAFGFFSSLFLFPTRIEARTFTPPEMLSAIQDTKTRSLAGLQFTLRQGDVLSNAITRNVDDAAGAYEAVRALREYVDLRRLRAGQHVEVTYAETPNGRELHSVIVPVSFESKAIALRRPDGSFQGNKIVNYLEARPVLKKGTVSSSLYQAGLEAGVPENRLVEMFDLFAFSVDFQRDIYEGDSFDIIYEEMVNSRGEANGVGNLLAARLITGGVQHKAFYFENDKGEGEYFDEDGKSVKKALLLTPVQGGRLTSGFYRRTNPIYGYTEFHPALDFAAPYGTPIMAGGNGTVIHRGWDPKGYGNYVMIRHNNGYITLYAHMSRFNSRAPVGARVVQGQTIGYIGSTGMSTGPHVHYEIRVNGRQLNPAIVVRNMSSGRILKGEEKELFKERIHALALQFD
jgi:murein DD-endopeptidase MepM/ murein hydrolase activator NlpD